MPPHPLPPLQHVHHQGRYLTSSGIPSLTTTGVHADCTVSAQQQPLPSSMSEHPGKQRRVDGEEGPLGKEHQHLGHIQDQWYESGAQDNIVPLSQQSQTDHGYSKNYASPSSTHHGQGHPHAHSPTQTSSMYTAPIPILPTTLSQWTNGGSAQAQGQYYHRSVPDACPQLPQIRPYPQQPYTSPTSAAPTEVFSLAGYPSSHFLPQANLISSGETPSSGVGSSSRDVIIGSGSGEPNSLNSQIRPNRHEKTYDRLVSKPYQRPTTSTARKARPTTYEGNLVRLQERCRRQGADEAALVLLGKIFPNGVSLEALTRPLTDAEVETREFGIDTGRVYNSFLGSTNGGEIPRYTCRLCHRDQDWKHSKDALRHLRRDHFGLADTCKNWYVLTSLFSAITR